MIDQFGSAAPEDYLWGAEQLLDAVDLWPLLPKIQAAMPWLMSFTMSMIPGWGDLYDLTSAVLGYDPIPGDKLSKWMRVAAFVAALIPILSSAQVRAADNLLNEEMAIERRLAVRYRVQYDATLTAGEGFTDEFGNIFISPYGTRLDRLQALYHEQVHAFLTPKGRWKSFRTVTLGGYKHSQLWRYSEEAMAESRAQLLTNGPLLTGLKLPFKQGYVQPANVALEAAALGGTGYGIYWAWQEGNK